MHCPQCGVERNLLRGRCASCGYQMRGKSVGLSYQSVTRPASSGHSSSAYTPTRGNNLDSGRYRLVEQISLPTTQRRQGLAWEAIDVRASHRLVMLREVLVPQELAKMASADQICRMAALRLQTLGQHAGLPTVQRFFVEHGTYFIVFDYPEGVSLASLLKRYGGALPEEQVATYGYQLCGLLSLLADAQPPFVHGSISPETIYIDEDQGMVSLIHLPLFKPDPPSASSGEVSTSYYAPEQVHGDISPATDLYALAVTMHHMVTGYDPRTRLALFHPPARRLNPAVTTQMELILTRQLSLSISQRYPHPSEMQRDLSTLLESYSGAFESEMPSKEINPLRMSAAELRERSGNMLMLNMGVFMAICVLLLIGICLVILR